jgi:hypothetical protein
MGVPRERIGAVVEELNALGGRCDCAAMLNVLCIRDEP